jgi:pantoate--beta-alanine ligase
MRTLRTIREMRAALHFPREQGRRIGLVPTMGAFHEGHLSLMRAALQECDLVVVSLFVNPTQFGDGEDLERYPRDERADAHLAADLGVDILFAPAVEEMYPLGFGTTVDPGPVAVGLDGAARPGHFEGVATVVTRLFGIVAPDVAYFGLKDFQQVAVIRRLVADLALPVEIRALPIVREADGLACSSRNRMLTPEARERAPALQRGLAAAEAVYLDGERSPSVLLGAAAEVIEPSGLVLEYLELRDAETLGPYAAERAAVIAAAVHVGSVRLIDNVTLAPPRAVVRLDASAELIRKASR